MQTQTLELNEVTAGLAADLKALRAGQITNADGRVRAQLGREILRGAHLQLEGLKYITANAKDVAKLSPPDQDDPPKSQAFDDEGKPTNEPPYTGQP